MKMNISAFACAAMVAASGVLSAYADATPYTNLNLSAANDWFTETAGSPTANAWKLGNTTVTPSTATVSSETVIDVDSDKTEPLTFTPVASTSSIFKVTFNLIAAKVPLSVNLDSTMAAGSVVGFAIKETEANVSKYRVCVNGKDWVALNDELTPPADGTAYTLTIEMDTHESLKNVRFTIGNGTPSDWFTTTAALGTDMQPKIDFVGTGYVKSLVGKQFTILSETVEINPGSGTVQIKINEAAMAKVKEGAGSGDVNTYLNTEAANGISNLDNLSLFGKVGTEVTATTKPAVQGGATEQPETSGNIVFNVTGLSTGSVDGAQISYQLQGKTTDGEWTNIGSAASSAKIEAAPGDYRFFRVKTTVTYTSVNK